MSKEFEKQLEDIRTTVAACNRDNSCGFISGSSEVFVNTCKSETPLMILFDSPANEKFKEGISLLESLMDACGISKNDYYISYIIKCCQLANDSNDKLSQAKYCRRHLANEFKLIKPSIIMLCGSGAYEAFFGVRPDGNKIRGEFITKNNYSIITSCNPCLALSSTDLKLLLYEDMCKIGNKLSEFKK